MSGIALVEALRGQVLCRYIVDVRKAVEDAAGPVRELYAAIEERSEREVRELADCAVGALRELVDVAEAVP
ncbi:MAG TPA: hypothetical protein PKB03_00030 [Baekduia sp.]|nr:hypothetical protein [Baekduia sp.]